jgi:hypothetical protein|tara:strand:+ start:2116 stop:2739 length:624 start_codon:yes stop_codon:yes gene_type:complete
MKPRQRKCKAKIDGHKCGIKFTPELPWQEWCSNDHQVVMAMEKLDKVRNKQAQERKKQFKADRQAERKAHQKRKQDVKPISKFHKKAATACNAYIRERDKADICISCDKPLAFEDKYDAGHWKTQGAHKWIAYDEVNINGQCTECNMVKSGNESAQRPRLVAKWGIEEVERLEQSGKNLGEKSYTREDLLEIEKKYKAKLKELINCD